MNRASHVLLNRAGQLLALLCLSIGASAAAAAPAPEIRSLIDIPYGRVDGKTLLLDLHLPAGIDRPPLVVYLHGGAWRLGDKTEVPPLLVERGYAVASLDFRSSEEARFPANVHDIKAGIRFLRAKAAEYGYRADRIAVSGSSSGGHLAALVGVTSGHPELEGNIGEYRNESSSVQAVVGWVGAYTLATIIMRAEVRTHRSTRQLSATATQQTTPTGET
jgi:carboxylesterase type B